MSPGKPAARLFPEEAAVLCDLLAAEEREYRRLRRLAWRQTAYLKRRDAARLESNAGEWRHFLPLADAARQRREANLRAVGARLALPAARLTTESLLTRADAAQREALRTAVRRLTDTAGDLYRQNGLNVMLARFCLELVAEEAAIFRQCVMDDPAGCYEGHGQRSTASGACIVQHRA
ncbi:MAG: flagellar export chaperone FlgN [Candidatus Krumholzibacteriia bacterium]